MSATTDSGGNGSGRAANNPVRLKVSQLLRESAQHRPKQRSRSSDRCDDRIVAGMARQRAATRRDAMPGERVRMRPESALADIKRLGIQAKVESVYIGPTLAACSRNSIRWVSPAHPTFSRASARDGGEDQCRPRSAKAIAAPSQLPDQRHRPDIKKSSIGLGPSRIRLKQ